MLLVAVEVLFLARLYGFLSRWVHPWAAATGTLLFACSVDLALVPVHGLETPLCSLFVLLVVERTLDLAAGRSTGWRAGLSLGLCCGLVFLARTDAGLFCAAAMLLLAWRRRWVEVLSSSLCAAVTVAPWLAWNLWTFGTVVQTSARTHVYRASVLLEHRVGEGSLWLERMRQVGGSLDYLLGALGGRLVLVPLLLLLWAALRSPRATGSWRQALLLGGAPAVVLAVLYGFFGQFQHWYVHPLSCGLVIAVAFLLDRWLVRFSGWMRPVPLVALLALLAAAGLRQGWYHYPWQRANHEAALFLRDNTREDVVLGSFNAGILGYFSERTTINLDGAVNNDMLAVLESRSLFAYARKRGIDLFVEHDNEFRPNLVFAEPAERGRLEVLWSLPGRGSGPVLILRLPRPPSDSEKRAPPSGR